MRTLIVCAFGVLLLFFVSSTAQNSACIEFNLLIQNVTCKGGSNGAANVEIVNGTGPFTYSWLPSTIKDQNATGLTAGIYTMTITDNENCTISQNIQIYEPPTGIKITWTSTAVSCSAKKDGTLSVSATGGSGPYLFNLSTGEQSPPSTSYTFRGLAVARKSIPTLTMFDDAFQPPFDDWSWAKNYSKTYTANVHSGEYAISLYPNNYEAVVFHCQQCFDTQLYAGVSYYINGVTGGQKMQSSVDDINNVYSYQNVMGAATPSATLPPDSWVHVFYDFSTINAPTTKLSGFRIQDASGFPSGNPLVAIDDVTLVPHILSDEYITVVDQNQCVARAPYAIDIAPEMTVNITPTFPQCHGSIGILQAVVKNGIPPYTFTWLPFYQNTQSIQSKATVEYDVEYIFDDQLENDFVDVSTSVVISYDYDIVFRGNTSVKYSPLGTGKILWYQNNTGINITQYLGIEFFFYLTSNTSGEINFALATYDVDQKQTTSYFPIDFNSLAGLLVIPANKWVKAFYNFNTLSPDTTLNAIWIKSIDDDMSPVYFDEIKFILATNTDYDRYRTDFYSVIVTDASSCSARLDNITLPEPPAFSVDVAFSQISCNQKTDGNITAIPRGGTRPYIYSWTLSQTAATTSSLAKPYVTGLPVTSAYVTVTDANSCKATSETVSITQPPALTTRMLSSKSVSCYGLSDGMATLVGSGGVPPYSLLFPSSMFAGYYVNTLPVYIFSEELGSMFVNATVPALGNLQDPTVSESGYYSIHMPNFEKIFFNCFSCFSVEEYVGISFWIYVPPQDGDFRMDLFFGATFLLGGEFSSNDPAGLPYTFFNRTNKWMQLTYTLPLNKTSSWSSFFILGYSITHPAMTWYIDTVELIPRWYSNFPQTTDLPSGFNSSFIGKASPYTATIKDSKGCSALASIFITQPDELKLNVVDKRDPSVDKKEDGWIKVNATGGTLPYEYIWGQPGGFGGFAEGLGDGRYNVTVVDKYECSVTAYVSLHSNDTLVSVLVPVVIVLSLVAGLCMILGLVALGLLMANPDFYLEKSPLFCKVIHFGVLIGYAAAIIVIPTPNDGLCIMFPWLVGISFTLVYGCLFLKTWRIFWIIRASKKMQKVNLTNGYIIKLLSLYSAFELAYLIAWTVIDPQKASLVDALNNQKQYQCDSKHYGIFWSIFLGYKFIWVIFGAIMAIGSRNMIEKFNESKQLYYCIYNTVIFSIICLPLQAILSSVPYADTAIYVALLLIIFTFTLVALYFGVWMKIIFGEDQFNLAKLKSRNNTPSPRSAALQTDTPRAGTPANFGSVKLRPNYDIQELEIPRNSIASSPTPISELTYSKNME